MAKWRNVKKHPISKTQPEDSLAQLPSFFVRFKSFMIDLFMLYVPIVYLLAYLTFDGAKDFRNSESAGIASMTLYGAISIIFWIKSGQTPGKRAYDLVLIDNKTQEFLTIPKAVLRYLAFLLSSSLIVGALLPLFRKDKKALHDLITDTSVVYKK